MAERLGKPPVIPPVIAPTEDEWRAMTPAARAAWFAGLGIPEYFVYDRRRQQPRLEPGSSYPLQPQGTGAAAALIAAAERPGEVRAASRGGRRPRVRLAPPRGGPTLFLVGGLDAGGATR